jgi:proline iminopeptidase
MMFQPNASEKRRSMRGDDLVPDAVVVATHAITIDAPPDKVWPWLAQMGGGRAGWYSYDRLDNGGMPSAEQIIEKYQSISVGDIMPALPGATDAFVVSEVAPPLILVLSVPLPEQSQRSVGNEQNQQAYRVSWAFVLDPLDKGQTRLLVRARLSVILQRIPFLGMVRFPTIIARILVRPIHFIMAQKQLRGIRARAERK